MRMPLEAPAPLDAGALHIVDVLQAAGHEAFLCGGCVRDLVLGTAPKDWDVATSARPEAVEALFARTVGVGRSFGVMLVVLEGRSYEVATFRIDSQAGDGRRPAAVRFCSAAEDVRRRDFTVNALLYDTDSAEVIDYVGGLDDLRAGQIRAVGAAAERLQEDYLRMLRAVRFTARLGFAMAPDLLEAIRELAGLVRLVSAERVGEELEKMLTEGAAGTALELLWESHLLLHVLPEMVGTVGMPQPPEFHPEGSVFVHTRLMLDGLSAGCDPALAWAVLLHDVGKPETLTVTDRIRFNNHPAVGRQQAGAILERLRRPRGRSDAVQALVGDHMRFTALPKMRVARRRRALRDPLFPLHLELHRLDCQASHRKLECHAWAEAAHREEMARPEPPPPLLNGNDLIAMGERPGPRFAEILGALADAQLEGAVTDRDGALAFVRQWLEEHP